MYIQSKILLTLREVSSSLASRALSSSVSSISSGYKALNIEPYGGFVNPEYELVKEGDKIVDVKVSYPANYIEQHLHYSKDYSFLPSIN